MQVTADHQKFVRQPSHVRAPLRPYVVRVRTADLKSLGDGIDTIDQDLLLSTPNEDSFDKLVKAREPMFWCEQKLVVIVERC
jgi:hypothetical protein